MPAMSKKLAEIVLQALRSANPTGAINKLVRGGKANIGQVSKIAEQNKIDLARLFRGGSDKGIRPPAKGFTRSSRTPSELNAAKAASPPSSSSVARNRTADAVRKAFASGKLLSSKQAESSAADSLKNRPGFGKFHLALAAAGGLGLGKLFSGGNNQGDIPKSAARQQILQMLLQDSGKANRQPLIDAQAELAKVKTMVMLQKIMAMKNATATAVPFS